MPLPYGYQHCRGCGYFTEPQAHQVSYNKDGVGCFDKGGLLLVAVVV